MPKHSAEVAGLPVGAGHPAFLVAELGVTHEASLEVASQMIRAAKEAGFNWRARFEAAGRDLPRDWEAWYLYRCFDIEHRVRRLSPRTVVPWVPQGGAAYALSASGAAIFHRALVPVHNAVDRVYMDVVKSRAIKAFAASPLLIDPGVQPSVINLNNPSKEWVENGVNRPPEYWPVTHLAHLGESLPETPQPLSSRLWETGARTLGRLLRRQDRPT